MKSRSLWENTGHGPLLSMGYHPLPSTRFRG
jgi:hypothetical protein